MGTKSTHHVTGWLQASKRSDVEKRNEAQRRIQERYFRQFCEIAARELRGNLSKRVDPDAVANAAFGVYFARPREKVVNRWSLWSFLFTVVTRKAADEIRKARAQKRDISLEKETSSPESRGSEGNGQHKGDRLVSRGSRVQNRKRNERIGRDVGNLPRQADSFFNKNVLDLRVMMRVPPDRAPGLHGVLAAEMIQSLEPELRQIALRALEGDGNREIADKLDISVRAVARKLILIEEHCKVYLIEK